MRSLRSHRAPGGRCAPRRPPRKPLAALLLPLLCALSSCATTHQVRPLGKGNGVLNVSFGGPLIAEFGAIIPTPVASVGGAYGVRDDLEVTGHVDVTGAAFGIVHLDPGVAYHPLIREHGAVPTLTVGGSFHVLTNFSSLLVAPDLLLAASWRIAGKHMVYVGADLAETIADRATPVFGPFIGGEARLGKRVGLALEVKWLSPWYNTNPTAPAWVSPGGYGYISIVLGLNVYFGGVR